MSNIHHSLDWELPQIIIIFSPYWSKDRLKSSPGIPILGQPLKLSPGVTQPLCFGLQIMVPGVSWEAWLSFPCGHHLRSSSSSSAPTGANTTYKSSPGIPIPGKPLKLSPGVTQPFCFGNRSRRQVFLAFSFPVGTTSESQ